MSKIVLPYGDSFLEVQLPNQQSYSLLLPKVSSSKTEKEIITESLAKPFNSTPLYHLAQNKKKAVIIISDNSRPVPSSLFLPYLINELKKGGLEEKQITIIIARGTHRALTEKEIRDLVGEEIYANITCLNSCPQKDDHIYLGETRLGTPVWVFRPILEADLKVVTGNLDFHRLTGFSAGVKGLFLAAAPKDSIAHNHSLSLEFKISPGELEGNPIRKDMEEFAKMAGVDFIFNVIVDYQHRILAAFAGDPIKAHQEGCQRLASLFQVNIKSPADLVIVSPGGSPKDINLYQAVKALQNALTIVRPRGIIVLAAQCLEDCGNPTLAHLIEELGAGEKAQNRLSRDFILGGHKLKIISEAIKKASIKIVTDLPDSIVQKLQFEKFSNLQEAIDSSLDSLRLHKENPQVIVFPYGGFVLPKLASRKKSSI